MPAALRERHPEEDECAEAEAAIGEIDDDTEFECWCGAKGKSGELYDMSCLSDTCGGSGTLNCLCGGDQCVCHWHGEIECPGCADCEGDEEDYDDD